MDLVSLLLSIPFVIGAFQLLLGTFQVYIFFPFKCGSQYLNIIFCNIQQTAVTNAHAFFAANHHCASANIQGCNSI